MQSEMHILHFYFVTHFLKSTRFFLVCGEDLQIGIDQVCDASGTDNDRSYETVSSFDITM